MASLDSEKLHTIFEEDRAFRQKEFPAANDLAEGAPLFQGVAVEDYQRRGAFWKGLLARLETLDKLKLNQQDRISYEMFKFLLEDEIAQIELEAYLTPISADGGFHVDFIYLTRQFSFQNEAEFERYIAVLGGFKTYVEAHLELMRLGLKKGRSLPKAVLHDYESYLDPHIVNRVEDSYFYQPFLEMPTDMPADRQATLKEKAREAILQSVIPGYVAFKIFLQKTYRPQASEKIGISEQPRGKEFYQQRIEFYTTLPLTADEIFQKGEEEVRRIKADMRKVIKAVGFEGSFADFLAFLRTDPQFYPKTPRELLKEAAYIAKKIDGKLPDAFQTMPRLPYGVAPVPDAIAPKYTTGRYSPGSAENHRAGFYWVNTYKLESRPLYVLPALTLHEAVPGHHLQISLAEEMENVPEFRRNTYLSCYGEGWALYCEWLGQELGIYETPYEEFGRMTYEMWRACRLVVDVGIHAKGWTRDQAVEFMASNTALSLHEVNTEIDRYIGWPGQALSYKIGELKIRELRQKAENTLGNRFDLRAFHDVILLNGSVPLFVLEDLVEAYIAEVKE